MVRCASASQHLQQATELRQDVVDIPNGRVYHRNPRYR